VRIEPDGAAGLGIDTGVDEGRHSVGLEGVLAEVRAAVRILLALRVPLRAHLHSHRGALSHRFAPVAESLQRGHREHQQRERPGNQRAPVQSGFAQVIECNAQRGAHTPPPTWSR